MTKKTVPSKCRCSHNTIVLLKYSTGRFPVISGSLHRTAPRPDIMMFPAWNAMARKEKSSPMSRGIPFPNSPLPRLDRVLTTALTREAWATMREQANVDW